MDGRVKTLHPGCMAVCSVMRDDPEHRQRRWRDHGIEPIDLLVVNLYPFEEVAQRRRRLCHGRREYRHWRPGNDPRRLEEPCLCRDPSPIRPIMPPSAN
jgi:hypothetical protein